MVNAKALEAARSRRRRKLPPLAMDNHLLRAGRQKRNPRRAQSRMLPERGTLCRRVLSQLRQRSKSVTELMARTGEDEYAIRYALSRLRNHFAWPIVNVAGRFQVGLR